MNTENIAVTCLVVIAVAAVAHLFVDRPLSRDFNNDGKVDIVDLSILAAEISDAQANQ